MVIYSSSCAARLIPPTSGNTGACCAPDNMRGVCVAQHLVRKVATKLAFIGVPRPEVLQVELIESHGHPVCHASPSLLQHTADQKEAGKAVWECELPCKPGIVAKEPSPRSTISHPVAGSYSRLDYPPPWRRVQAGRTAVRYKNSESPPAVRQRRLSKKSLPRQVEHSFLKQSFQLSNVQTRRMERQSI